MHEYPVTERIIEIAKKHCEMAQASRVEAITLVVGEQSGFIGESIQMYFDIMAEGTVCEGAALILKPVKPLLECRACGARFQRRPLSFSCPECGGEGAPTDVGKEFYIEAIAVVAADGQTPPPPA